MCQITILSRKFEFPPYNITLRHFGTLLFSGLPMMINSEQLIQIFCSG